MVMTAARWRAIRAALVSLGLAACALTSAVNIPTPSERAAELCAIYTGLHTGGVLTGAPVVRVTFYEAKAAHYCDLAARPVVTEADLVYPGGELPSIED